MKNWVRNVLLKSLSVVPVLPVAFAAQSALAIGDYEGGLKDKRFQGKLLMVDGIEYNLKKVFKASEQDTVGGISVEFIRRYKEEILNGEVDGVAIVDGRGVEDDGGSWSDS